MAVEQEKSTIVVIEENSRINVLPERQVYGFQPHQENLDVTLNRPDNQHVESEPPSGTADLLSYNLDVHAYNEQLSPVDLGPSIGDEATTELANEASRNLSLGRNNPQHTNVRQALAEDMGSDENKTDKVFILHFTDDDDDVCQDEILQLASSLRQFNVNITLDLFEKDTFQGNWNIWYEKELKESKIVLCIITKNFNHQLKTDIKGDLAYNLLSDRTIPFIPIFLDSKVNEKHIPLIMRGSNCYSVSLRDIPKQKGTACGKSFENLYSYLTAQNRAYPPELGETIPMLRHKSVMSGREEQPTTGYAKTAPMPLQKSAMSEEEKTFLQLKTITTPVMSLPSHNKMFSQLASNLTAEWEPLGRELGVSEANMYAIKRDNMYSVTEQAVKMFQQWLRQNGSLATIQDLASAVYESGPKYWELLKVLCRHTL